MIRKRLNPIIFVICNDGYTIERYIHGMDATYNDIGKWNYKELLPTLGAEEGTYKTYQVKTMKEVQGLLNDDDFAQSSKLRVCCTWKLDVFYHLLTSYLVCGAVHAQRRRTQSSTNDCGGISSKQC